MSELRCQSKIEGARVVSVGHDHILLSSGQLIECASSSVVVACTGPRLDAAAKVRAQAQMATMSSPSDNFSILNFLVGGARVSLCDGGRTR